MSPGVKKLVAVGVAHGGIKAPLSSEMDWPLINKEARDRYLECWWRLREIELQLLKLDNERLREELLMLSFERASIANRKL